MEDRENEEYLSGRLIESFRTDGLFVADMNRLE
jgi:hypothetical protein